MSMPPPGFTGPPPQGPPPGPPRAPQQGPPPGFPGGHQPGPHPQGGYPQGPPPPAPHLPGVQPGLGGPGVAPAQGGSRLTTAIWLLAAIALAGVVLGLSLQEDGHNAWHTVHAWGALPIVGAALTAAPALGAGGSLTPRRAWQLAIAGAALLVLFWILLVLPDVGSNTSLLTTVGTAAGVLCAWIAPTGTPVDGRNGPPPGHVW